MKTVEEIIAESLREQEGIGDVWAKTIVADLDAAGYHITPNLPPNTAVNITTDEHGHIVQFKPHSETQKGQPQ